jgi:hypothetical protein
MADTIRLKTGGIVLKKDYIEAKTKDLKEFGYSKLTTEEVAGQVEKILDNDKDLTVIGLFIADDLAPYEMQPL